MSDTVTIAREFNGPTDSGNGGYVSGLLAKRFDEIVSVSLRMPPPLDTPLAVAKDGDALNLTLADGTLVAHTEPGEVNLEIPSPPSFEEAVAADPHYAGHAFHALPDCFVCGPGRKHGDGLRIFASPIEGSDLVASPWVPDARLADDGIVREEFVWAALDCPGYFAVINAMGSRGEKILTARMAASLKLPVKAGDRHVVIGWRIKSEGRKHWAGTALFNDAGELAACAEALWIKPREQS